MPIPQVKTWQRDTSRVGTDRKNPLILDIDRLLTGYHTAGKTPVQKQKILILMLYYCTEWLVTKGEKDSSWRRAHVKSLVSEIESELRTTPMVAATQARIDKTGAGAVTLKENPIEVLQPRDARQKFGLKSDVTWGRKSAHNAGSFVTSFGSGKKLTGYLGELQGKAVTDYVDELQILAAHGRTVKRNLEYLSSKDRRSFCLARWPSGLWHLGGRDHAYTTANGTDTANQPILDLFAMDEMQLLYVGSPKSAGTFHHSSFLSGKAVLCAGEIEVTQGKITKISNGSGHYLPPTADLLKCVEVLKAKGVDMQSLRVSDQATKTDWRTAQLFLSRRGVPLPQIGKRT